MGPGGGLARITLLILSTVTVFLLMEVDRLRVLDNVNAQLSKLDIDAIARDFKHQHLWAGRPKRSRRRRSAVSS